MNSANIRSEKNEKRMRRELPSKPRKHYKSKTSDKGVKEINPEAKSPQIATLPRVDTNSKSQEKETLKGYDVTLPDILFHAISC